MLLLWILVLVVGIAYLAHRRIAPLPALCFVALPFMWWRWVLSAAHQAGYCWFCGY